MSIPTAADAATVVASSTPYPWPWDGLLHPARCALLVVEATAPRAPHDHPALVRLRDAAERLRSLGVLVVTVHTSGPASRRATPATAGGTDWTARGADVVTSTPAWDGFFASPLDSVLRGADRDLLLLAGSWLEIGVHSTMRSANDRGYECLLLDDLCVAVDEDVRPAARSTVEMSGGIFGAVGTTPDLLDALARVDFQGELR